MSRIQLNEKQISEAINKIQQQLIITLDKKGYGTFASSHEILGIITEEYKEFIDAVHNNNYYEISNEIIDLAVVCIFGLTCIDQRTIDW